MAAYPDLESCSYFGERWARFGEREIAVGVANLFVATQDRVYVAPSLVAHYIDAHEYAPPAEFQQAVLSSPPMKSMDYYRLLRKHGIDGLAKRAP